MAEESCGELKVGTSRSSAYIEFAEFCHFHEKRDYVILQECGANIEVCEQRQIDKELNAVTRDPGVFEIQRCQIR